MAWYRAGTVAVTNGNATVTGTNTDFVSNTQVGESFIGPNGLSYEIAAVVSATQLTLSDAYQGPSGGGQSYKIQPTQSFARDLALAFAGFKNTFGGILDTVGQGLFGDGSAAAPGMRFTSDQDTGIRRSGENTMALVAGGENRFVVSTTETRSRLPSSVGDTVSPTTHSLDVSGAITTATYRILGGGAGNPSWDWGTGDSSTRWTLGYTFNAARTVAFAVDGATGNVGIGTSAPSARLDIACAGSGPPRVRVSSASDNPLVEMLRTTGVGGFFGARIAMDLNAMNFAIAPAAAVGGQSYVEAMRIDPNGNLLVGTTTGAWHSIYKNASADSNAPVISFAGPTFYTALFYSISGGLGSAAKTAMKIGFDASTGRSINAGGTINASGADYAEYIRKATGCGRIAKGEVCGIDRNGELVRTWSDMLRPVIKSTDPNLVGGDTWAAHLGPRPEEPVFEAPLYEGPAEPEEGADRRAYDAARADHAKAVAAAEAAHAIAVEQHAAALATWEAELEAARQTVDRIAFCGQVPVNVDADTLAACEAALADGVAVYLVAIAKGAGIGVTAVREADMTLPAYMRRVGAVWAIRDGRPWIDVQHG